MLLVRKGPTSHLPLHDDDDDNRHHRDLSKQVSLTGFLIMNMHFEMIANDTTCNADLRMPTVNTH